MAVTALRRAPRSAAATAMFRLRLAGGARTTVHVAARPLATTELRVVVLDPPGRLLEWCAAHGVEDAIVGGFFTRAGRMPLGEVRTHGVLRQSEPFDAPWQELRSCLHVYGGMPLLAPRKELPAAPRGELLQAGPLLLRNGRLTIVPGEDPEGFSAGHAQFDSDITAGRHPRAALGIGGARVIAVACDGRADREAGLTLHELARLMGALGARDAINLDGGGSTSLVTGGALVNRPRDAHGAPPHAGRAICTAIAFVPVSAARHGIEWQTDDLAASPR
jgi:hypothetical protein